MLIDQMLVALFLGIGNLRLPTPFLHDFPCSKDGILKKVMTVEMGGIFDQVGIVDVPPSITITITYTRDVPGGMANGTGYELT
jgi:hypothetical protein